MRPELFRLAYGPLLALAFAAAGFVACVVLASRGGAAPRRSVTQSLLAVLTCGLGLGRDGPDLFVPGAAGFILGVLPLAIVLARGPFEIPVASYPFALACGFLCAITISAKRAKPRGIQQAHVLDIAIICLIAGPVGARGFFVWQYWDKYFSDKPAALILGEPEKALAPGDELVVRTADGEARVVFQGGEHTPAEIFAKLDGALAAARVRVQLLTLDRRIGDEVVHKVRGVSLESFGRGPGATVSAAGGAAVKLGVAGVARGVAVPWTRSLEIWNGGIVFYGGLLFATAAAIFYVRMRGYRVLAVADVVAPVLALGLAFGRVGCTLNGCCWGRPIAADSPFALRFPVFSFAWAQHARSVLPASYDAILEKADRAQGLDEALRARLGELCNGSDPVHAVQIYDIVLELALFAALLAFGRRISRREGPTFFLFFWVYAIVRFVEEHFRGDHPDFVVLLGYPLTMSQRVSLVTLPIGLAGFAWALKRGRPSEPQVEAPEVDEKNTGASG